jgi:hypothetical protein
MLAGSAHALPGRLPPVEQCSGDRGFVQFRNRLKQVVARKDRAALLAMLAPDVMIDFGGGAGREEFARRWSFDPNEYGNVWTQLQTMLKLGCTSAEGASLIPSLSEQLNDHGADEVFELRLVLPGAKLYRESGNEHTAAPIAAWSLATAVESAGDLWTRIRLADGREGLVSDDVLYEPLGYRMVVQKRSGRWMITVFVAGD